MPFQVWDDWSAGEFGELGPYHAPDNSFTGTNVIRYTNGLLGPRPGLRICEFTGIPSGTVWGIFAPEKVGKALLVVIGDSVYSTASDTSGAMSLVGALNVEPTNHVHADWYDPNGEIYLGSPNDCVYAIDWTAGTITQVDVDNHTGVDPPTQLGVQVVKLVRNRLYVGGAPSELYSDSQRVFYSKPATNASDFDDFTVASSGGYFDVGYYWDVYAMVEIQNSMLIGTRAAGWWSLVGAVPGGDLRQVDTFLSPGKHHEVVKGQNEFYYWASFPGTGTPDPTLVVSNGAKFDDSTLQHLRLAGTERFGVYISRYKTVLYTSNTVSAGFTLNNGAWSEVEWEVPISGPMTAINTAADAVLAGGNDPASFYQFTTNLDRPAFLSDTNAQPGDNSGTPINAFFYTPIYFDPTARDMRPRRVIVDFQKWNTGVTNNSFSMNLRTFSRYNETGGTQDDYASTSQTWTEAATAAAADSTGTTDRVTFRVGSDGYGSGFQVGITAMIGVAIHKITVEYDDQESSNAPNEMGRPR